MSLISVFNQIQTSTAEECIIFQEYIDELVKFNASLEKFKSRIPLISYVEINPKQYRKDPPLDGYLKLETREALLDHILHREDKTSCFSFKVVFKNGQEYYTNSKGASSYTSDYNSLVVKFLSKWL